MAKKSKSQKNASKKKSTKKAASTGSAPKIVLMKGGLTVSALVAETLAMMEDNLRISKKAGADFAESLAAVVEQQLEAGEPVNLFHIVKVVPRLHTKGEREVNETFGDPTSKKVTKKYPAKVSLAVKKGSRISGKKGADLLPTVAKLTKKAEEQAKAKSKSKPKAKPKTKKKGK